MKPALPALIEIKNTTVFRGATKVFENLNLRIEQDENVAILGPNGAGKSTLLKLLTREIYPVVKENSFVKVFGSETVNVKELRQRVSWVSYDFQTDYLPITTAYDVVMSGLLGTIGNLYQFSVTAEQHQITYDLMEKLQLLPLKDKMFFHLSSGQQRRLLLARAQILKPQTIILDEPTSSLDIQGCFQVLNDMQQLINQGTSVLLATHHIHEVIPAIKRIIFIHDGKILADGDKTSLFTAKNLSELYQTPLKLLSENGYFQVLPA